MSVISIGAQSGGPKDGGIGSIKVDLYKALRAVVASTHCEAIDEYAPVLRISGPIQDFGAEEITRLRFAKKKRYITADIQVPESVWQPKSKNEIRDYLAAKLLEVMNIFVLRLEKESFSVNKDALFQELHTALGAFKDTNYEK